MLPQNKSTDGTRDSQLNNLKSDLNAVNFKH